MSGPGAQLWSRNYDLVALELPAWGEMFYRFRDSFKSLVLAESFRLFFHCFHPFIYLFDGILEPPRRAISGMSCQEEAPREDPGLAGEIISVGWLGNNLVSTHWDWCPKDPSPDNREGARKDGWTAFCICPYYFTWRFLDVNIVEAFWFIFLVCVQFESYWLITFDQALVACK